MSQALWISRTVGGSPFSSKNCRMNSIIRCRLGESLFLCSMLIAVKLVFYMGG